MWLIVLCVVIVVFGFVWLFVRGSDMKNRDSYARMVEDEQQEKALAQISQRDFILLVVRAVKDGFKYLDQK